MSTILKLCQDIPVRTVEPGTVLLAEGIKDGTLCVLAGGEVEILKGEFQVNTVSEPGAVFGEMSLLLGSAHTATVRARTRCRVHVIAEGEAFLRSNSDVAYDLLKTMAGRLRGVTNHLTDLNRYIHAM
ncbi:MAG TPA: cyclic nucleotide-binding domain-containing protein [Rhizomicrobium sp.]|nr:cyclic nucleotide-binding domain-containing protein [Rhizomicrobium sp.]